MRAPTSAAIALAAIVVGAADVALLVDRTATEPVPSGTSTERGPAGTDEPPEAETLQGQLERVARIVAEVRELPFDGLPAVRWVAPAQLAAEIRDELAAYTVEEADLDGRVLAALGVVDRGTDLRELLLTAYSEQVAGFYDPEAAEIVVPSDADGQRLGRIDELTLAHELGHALVDAAIGLVSDDLDEEAAGEDRLLALTALQEGDAQLVMTQYVEAGFSMVDQLALAQEALGLADELAGLTELPGYLQASLEFPYLQGLEFVLTLHADGGWAAVDAAYAAPPKTTYEILFPDAYLQGFTPTEPPPFVEPAGDWARALDLEMGASDVLLLLDDADIDGARAAAAGWRGGRLRLWTDGDASAVAWHLAHDGGEAFCRDLADWYDAAILDDRRGATDAGAATWEGSQQSARLACDDTSARLAIAPAPATASSMVAP